MTSAAAEHDEQHRLTAVQGLAALSLDALSSVAYGPEAILVVLVAGGATALHYAVPITAAIIVLLAVLVVSYRQVIAAFPTGGGAYAVSKAHLGTQASLVAAASLIVDYVLNAAVGVSAGVAALTSAFPVLYGARVWLCLAALALITGLNLWGVSESAKVFTVPTVLFIVAIAAVILGGLFRSQPAVPLDHHVGAATEAVGALLILKAFASGCARTGRCTGTAWWCWPCWPPPCWWRPRATRRRWSRCSPWGCSSGSRCPRSAWSGTGGPTTPAAG